LTGGQSGDCPQAPGLLVGHLRPGQAVLADRAYDAGYVRDQIQHAGAAAVIPGKKNRTLPIAHDAEIYKRLVVAYYQRVRQKFHNPAHTSNAVSNWSRLCIRNRSERIR